MKKDDVRKKDRIVGHRHERKRDKERERERERENQAKRELEKPYVHAARSLLTSPPRDLLENAAP